MRSPNALLQLPDSEARVRSGLVAGSRGYMTFILSGSKQQKMVAVLQPRYWFCCYLWGGAYDFYRLRLLCYF